MELDCCIAGTHCSPATVVNQTVLNCILKVRHGNFDAPRMVLNINCQKQYHNMGQVVLQRRKIWFKHIELAFEGSHFNMLLEVYQYYYLILFLCIHFVDLILMSHVTRKPVFGVCDQIRLEPPCSATETS